MNQNRLRSNPELIAKPQLQLNDRLQNVMNNLAVQMPNGNRNYSDPLSQLSPEDISYLQAYLEQIKIKKINQAAIPSNIKYCSSVGDAVSNNSATRQTLSKIPINPQVNQQIRAQLRNAPVANDVQPAYPGPVSDYLPIGQNEFRNGFGAGTGIDNKIFVKTGNDISRCGYNNNFSTNRMTDIYNPMDRDIPIPSVNGSIPTRTGRKSTNTPTPPTGQQSPLQQLVPCANIQNSSGISNSYYNPYEYGAKQNQLGSIYKPTYTGPYAKESPDLLSEMGISDNLYNETFPGSVRNVNVESTLWQKETTHLPGQRELTEKEINRFELLPFDPQDTNHIVWRDSLPRGGINTRDSRFETY